MKNIYPQVSYKIDRIPDTNLVEPFNIEIDGTPTVLAKMNYAAPDINMDNFKSAQIANYHVDISEDKNSVIQTVTFDIVEESDYRTLENIVNNDPKRLFEHDLFLRKFSRWLNVDKGYYDIRITRTE